MASGSEELFKSNIDPCEVCRKRVMMMLLLLSDPFREMGAWRKNMETQKPGNVPGPGPEVTKRQRVAKKRAAQNSVPGQCRMK